MATINSNGDEEENKYVNNNEAFAIDSLSICLAVLFVFCISSASHTHNNKENERRIEKTAAAT